MINRDALTGEGVEGNEGGFYLANFLQRKGGKFEDSFVIIERRLEFEHYNRKINNKVWKIIWL